eukprot:2564123-Rhodomonas_salina.1
MGGPCTRLTMTGTNLPLFAGDYVGRMGVLEVETLKSSLAFCVRDVWYRRWLCAARDEVAGPPTGQAQQSSSGNGEEKRGSISAASHASAMRCPTLTTA